MADADNKNNTSEQANGGLDGIKQEIASSFAQMNEQMKAMTEQYAQGLQTLASAVIPKKQEAVDVSDDDIYEPAKLKQKILAEATREAQTFFKAEREKDLLIANLSQEYPEISSDAKVRAAVLAEQKNLPESIRNTATGYEMAVLRAVANQGIVAKSRRKQAEPDADISFSGSRSSEGSSKARKGKGISEATLRIAELLGRDTSDPKVLKGLEEASNRDTFGRYR